MDSITVGSLLFASSVAAVYFICKKKKAKIEDNGMLGSVKPYHRHILIVMKGKYEDWPSHIESSSDIDTFPLNVISHIEKRIKEIKNSTDNNNVKIIKVKITICHDDREVLDSSPVSCQNAEFIVYPDNVQFTVSPSQSKAFAELMCRKERINALDSTGAGSFVEKKPPLWQNLLLVCVHGSRDKRCGRAGPPIIDELRRLLKEQNIPESDIAVRATSHIGGHKYAGTLIVYPDTRWYGRITARGSTVSALLEHVKNNAVFEKCYRGCVEW